MNNIYETPLSAWQSILKSGGIELQNRDKGLDNKILAYIDPTALSLEDALSNATMEAFVRAFFTSLSPYVDMFRDILSFFEHADATQGKTQWTLKVGEVNLDLEHFRQWLNAWQQLVKHEIEVSVVNTNTAGQIQEILRKRFSYSEQENVKKRSDVSSEIKKWLMDLESGVYSPMPQPLDPWTIQSPLSKLASIIYVKLQILNDLNLDHQRLLELYFQNQNRFDASDSLALGTILQNETDYWLRSASPLLVLATLLTDVEQKVIECELESITNKFPLRKFVFDVTINGLDSVLSFPIWKQRYELYAVWIATEMIKALDGHEIQIHHDNGQIRFDFKETLIATIHSSEGPFKLIGEKRIPLVNPVGHGRKQGVQPDHQLWTKVGNSDVCKMAVEVKHYKNSAKSKFIDIFEDYARAIPDGDVYLVNHGPVGSAASNVSPSLAKRCFSIGNLTPQNLPERKKFADAIRRCVGEPPTTAGKFLIPTGAKVFMIDVSGSMSRTLQSDEMKTFLRHLMNVENATELVAVDTKIVGRFKANDVEYATLSSIQGGNTNLRDSVSKLLEEYSQVLVITDFDGKSYLSEFEITAYATPKTIPMKIEILVCRNLTS